MATTQYIGARYVPKFYEGSNGTEWTANTQYEPLTIVTRNGNSYTSKKPVPASVGAPENNAEYWASTGIYSAQVESLREDIEENAENIDTLTSRVNTLHTAQNIVLFGDSWADPNSGINSVLAEYLGRRTGKTVLNYSASGAGFYTETNSITQQINRFIADAINTDSIFAFVFVCGVNDVLQNAKTATQIAQAFNSAVALLPANVPVYWFPTFSANGLSTGVANSGFYEFYFESLRSYNNTVSRGAVKSLFGTFSNWYASDYFHPDTTGSAQIGVNIGNVLLGADMIEYPVYYDFVPPEGIDAVLGIRMFVRPEGTNCLTLWQTPGRLVAQHSGQLIYTGNKPLAVQLSSNALGPSINVARDGVNNLRLTVTQNASNVLGFTYYTLITPTMIFS